MSKESQNPEEIVEETKTVSEDASETKPKEEKKTKKVKKLEEEIAKLTADVEEAQNAKLRTLAEFDNFRKRSASEYEMIRKTAASNVIEDLLPVIDNLERALTHIEEGSELRSGIEMVYKQLLGILENNNVSEIACEGVYDPNFHQPMMTETSENHETDEIIEVLQKGYIMEDKVLRYAMVKVAV